jgi:hypothetical protein
MHIDDARVAELADQAREALDELQRSTAQLESTVRQTRSVIGAATAITGIGPRGYVEPLKVRISEKRRVA